MADLVAERVAEAQSLLIQRAERLKKLLDAPHNENPSEEFIKGAELVQKLIEGQSELLNQMVFEAPKTVIEQLRNLRLATGNMDQTVVEGMKSTTDAIDGMLDALESMVRSR
ncbi:MAG: hypothetical protein J5742_02070 [Alphaproteobacteria bacterium]|nr:hypothetical protein [Alphaproteobacteria bacterium]